LFQFLIPLKNIYFEDRKFMHMISMKRKGHRMLLYGLLLLMLSCSSVNRYIHSSDVLGWEPDIARFDSLNRVEYADGNTVLVAGSSSVRLWDSIHPDLEPYSIMQRGYGGAKLSDFNHYAERIIKPQPFRAIVIFVANDISGGENDRTPREVLKLWQALVDQIRSRNTGTPVFWIETTPTPSRWNATGRIRSANRKIRRYCERNPDLHFIETYESFIGPGGTPDSTLFRSDMLHLNRDGYKLWAALIKDSLEKQGILP
jgi:hypothetical protein